MDTKKSLINLIYANGENLLNEVSELIQAGADVNEKTKYFETPIRVASNKGRFDVVKLLFERGVDPEHLKWTELFHAVAYGSLLDIQKRLESNDLLEDRDTWNRTPFLVAVQTGDIEKVKLVLLAGADKNAKGRCDKTPIEYAIQSDDHAMLAWLIEQGFNPEEYNTFGYTPLIEACEKNSVNCVKTLIKIDVDIFKKDRGQFCREAALAHTRNTEIAKMLISKGADINELSGSNDVRLKLLGLNESSSINASKEDYLAGKYRRFGEKNPEICQYKFWYDMVRNGKTAWYARDHFGESDYSEKPIWCYERYGKSITDIGNNQFIEIGGEHEDSYDPDFCIYNEIILHKGDGDFDIYMYPKEVFPPTDNHTATLVGKFIYIIGNLGYREAREFGTTPVYRLNIDSFTIEKVVTNGKNPGWIFNHVAVFEDDETICIKEGVIAKAKDDQEHHENNKFDYKFNTRTLAWSQNEAVPLGKEPAFFPEEEKQFEHSNGTLVSFESNDKWYAFKIIEVHRLDVNKGQSLSVNGQIIKMLVDDFVFIPIYIQSQAFECLKSLKEAVQSSNLEFEPKSLHCRAINFPNNCRYLGFQDISKKEKKLFKNWLQVFKNIIITI